MRTCQDYSLFNKTFSFLKESADKNNWCNSKYYCKSLAKCSL